MGNCDLSPPQVQQRAGFLYDLADNASTPNLDPGADDDPVSYGAAYVGDVIEACEVREFGQWIRANGLDHLIYCFERRLSTYAAQGFFPTRPIDPTDWSVPVTLPSGWNANTIKTVWQDVAYPLGAPVAPLTADIAGPSQVRPFDFCAWQSVVNGGTPPYQYQWSGVLSGTSSFVTGSLSSSGTLWLEVTSSDQQQVTTSFPISVSSGAQECMF